MGKHDGCIFKAVFLFNLYVRFAVFTLTIPSRKDSMFLSAPL